MTSRGRNGRWRWLAVAAGTLALGGGVARAQRAGDTGDMKVPGGAMRTPTPGAADSPPPGANDSKAGGAMDNLGISNRDRPRPTAGRPAAPNEEARVVARLHHDNEIEIDAGKLAQDKGRSRAVRDFGARLVRDHQAADQKLLAYAGKKGIDANAMPAPGGDDEARAEDMIDRIRNLAGAAFDRELGTVMEESHRRAIDFVQGARDRVGDGALRAMLSQLLPTLQRHQEMARQLLSPVRNVSGDDSQEQEGDGALETTTGAGRRARVR